MYWMYVLYLHADRLLLLSEPTAFEAFYNFIQRPLPAGGNGTGATPAGTQLTPGALGLGLQVATAVTTSFSFVACK